PHVRRSAPASRLRLAAPRRHQALPPFPTRRSSDLGQPLLLRNVSPDHHHWLSVELKSGRPVEGTRVMVRQGTRQWVRWSSRGPTDRKSTRLNSSHVSISYAVFCLKKKTVCPASHDS